MRSYQIDTYPTTPVVTTTECKTHLRVDHSDDDTYIATLQKAATATAEGITNRFFIETTLIQYGDRWEDITHLFRSPGAGITNIKYMTGGVLSAAIASSIYLFDSSVEPPQISLKEGQSWPTDNDDELRTIKVTYKVGYGTAASSVPEGIKQAILIMVGDWYENRQSVIVGRVVNLIPKTAEYLLNQYKVQVL
tara:strand:+ start:241 stop:819 length:579 start_codon:yes stop_codon:yes gene_type:complete